MERVKTLTCWKGEDVKIKAVTDVRDELQLGEGRTNQNFIVDSSRGRSFVRIGSDLPFFGVSRAREQAAAKAAASSDLGPAVVHTELPDALVVDFVQGRALTEADVHTAAAAGRGNPLLGKITDAIRKLHASAVPDELNQMRDSFPGVDSWGGPHMAKWLAYAEAEGFKRLPLLRGVRELVAKLEAAAGPPGPAKFCHFDLLADNFVLQPSGDVLLVDFEYAALGQPLMDLAVLAMGCSLEPDEERNLLASYLGSDVTEAQVRSFKAVRVLAALRETLWGTAAELSKSSALSPKEAKAYCDLNYKKFAALRREFENSLIPVAPAPSGAVEMKVTAKRNGAFYAKAAETLLKGVEAQPAENGRDAVEAKKPADSLRISGLGESIHCAIAAATSMEATGLASICRIQTAYPSMEGGGCAQILIDVKKK